MQMYLTSFYWIPEPWFFCFELLRLTLWPVFLSQKEKKFNLHFSLLSGLNPHVNFSANLPWNKLISYQIGSTIVNRLFNLSIVSEHLLKCKLPSGRVSLAE